VPARAACYALVPCFATLDAQRLTVGGDTQSRTSPWGMDASINKAGRPLIRPAVPFIKIAFDAFWITQCP